EVSTLIASLHDWTTQLQIKNVRLVADRAMMSEANLAAMEAAGFKYIVAAKLKALPKKLEEEILARRQEVAVKVSHQSMMAQELQYNSRRLVVSYSESRAKKDKSDRDKLLASAEKKFGSKVTSRKLITNKGLLKYYQEKSKGEMVLNHSLAAEEARWD